MSQRAGPTTTPPRSKNQGNRRGSSREKVALSKIAAALKAAGGVIGKAAELAGVHRSNLHRYIERHPELRDVVHEAREHVSDLAEVGLIRDIEKGRDWRLRWRWLSTFARHRGFAERLEINDTDDLRKLREENRELERRLLQREIDGRLPAILEEERRRAAMQARLQ